MFGADSSEEMCVFYVMFYYSAVDVEIESIPDCLPREVKVTWEQQGDVLGEVPNWVERVSLGESPKYT